MRNDRIFFYRRDLGLGNRKIESLQSKRFISYTVLNFLHTHSHLSAVRHVVWFYSFWFYCRPGPKIIIIIIIIFWATVVRISKHLDTQLLLLPLLLLKPRVSNDVNDDALTSLLAYNGKTCTKTLVLYAIYFDTVSCNLLAYCRRVCCWWPEGCVCLIVFSIQQGSTLVTVAAASKPQPLNNTSQ